MSAKMETSGSTGFKVPKAKGLNRPTTWFQPLTRASSSSSSSTLTASTSSNASSSSAAASTATATAHNPNPFTVPSAPNLPPPSSFKSPFPSSKGKHKLSPSPSPSARIGQHDEDFVMISPIRSVPSTASPLGHKNMNLGGMEMMRDEFGETSSPLNDSPTPACGVASATARLRLVDDESPIRRVPGQSRSLKPGPDGAGLFSTGERRRQPSSPLKFAAASCGMDDDDTPPTPTTTGPSIPQPLFSAARQQTTSTTSSLFGAKIQESRIPRLTTSQPLRARSGTTVESDGKPTLGGKKAISLDRIPIPEDDDEPFGSPFGNPTPATGRKLRLSHGPIGSTSSYRAHKRINSGEQHSLLSAGNTMSRSQGLKSGLALNLSPNSLKLPEFGSSNSSLSSLSTAHLTPPTSAFSPAEPSIPEGLRPLEEEMVIQEQATVEHKFKPRDSGLSMGDDDEAKSRLHPTASMAKLGARQQRPAMLKRTSSAGNERSSDDSLETPLDGPSPASGWPTGGNFQFVGENGEAMNMRLGAPLDDKPMMPGTPVKKQAYSGQHPRIGHSNSQPTLIADWSESGPSRVSKLDIKRDRKSAPSAFMPPQSTKKPSAKSIPQLTLTANSPGSPASPSNSMDTDLSSPTVRLSSHAASALGPIAEAPPSRVGMLRRLSSGVGSSDGSTSEEEGTPTKHGGDKHVLAASQASSVARTPTPKTHLAAAVRSAKPTMPRMSLPASVHPARTHRTLHHRQSHPATSATIPTEEEDIFEERFITLDTIGKGAFSTVLRVQERYGEGIYAVKKARGVFDGVRDRLRHLEEVDILRHLSVNPHPNVIKFEDAWEQNRQLFIQTELCLGSLAFFLLEYGSVVERLDEARVWKIVRELSDGIHHIHTNGVVHFDIKPANILISSAGSLKIGDFGLASRYPRVTPDEILEGSGLGGSSIPYKDEKLEREGDRVYMPPEMLRGIFVMAADIFSFGLVILEVATNICVPDGGPAWQALRSNDFDVIDLSPISPVLADLITNCMNMEPTYRPTIEQIVSHPVIQRARVSIPALAPQPKGWLASILAGGTGFGAQIQQPLSTGRYTEDGDIIME